MNYQAIEYVKSLKPTDMPNGMDILAEGIQMGKEIPLGKSKFLEESGYPTYAAYKKDCVEKGKIIWEILLGLGSLEEQIDGIKKIYEFSQKTGLEINTVQCIPSQLITLPKEYRENAPKPTSYTIENPEDWAAHQAGVPMQILFEDQVLSCPNSLETTINSIRVGSARIGLISQFIWGQPGFTDDKQHIIDMVKSIGMVASKKDDYIVCDTYLDDGLPGYAMDCVTYVGYALLEHYIVSQLCGARFQVSYGGLLSEGVNRLGVAVAIHKLLSTEDQPAISYINSSTVMQWDHDIEANYGPSLQEILLEALVERKYKMGMMINPVSITEKITTPTLQDLLNIFSAGARTLERIEDWEVFMDWTNFEKVVDVMMVEGKKFFENTLEIMKQAGININDPLEMFMMLKKMNPSKFEGIFHHHRNESGAVEPFFPTVLGRQTLELKDKVAENLYARGIKKDDLEGKRVAVVSGDGHAYGLTLVDAMLSEVGAKTVNGGVDIDPAAALDLADEEGINMIGISVHNGQCLDYAKQISELAAKRGKKYHIFMGGKLNTILPGDTVTSDVTDLINETGVLAADDLFDSIQMLKNN